MLKSQARPVEVWRQMKTQEKQERKHTVQKIPQERRINISTQLCGKSCATNKYIFLPAIKRSTLEIPRI